MKFALLGKRLTGAISLFRITKENILVADGASGFSVAAGRARGEGVEADANFALGDRFTLTAVYAYTDARLTQDTRSALVGSGLLTCRAIRAPFMATGSRRIVTPA